MSEPTEPDNKPETLHNSTTDEVDEPAAKANVVELVAETELEQTQKRLHDTEARLRVVSKAYTDLEAEMDAFRRRMTVQADQRVERKVAEVVEQFFDPVQNLRRSMASADTDPAGTLLGLKMTLSQFNEAMTRLGLEEVPGVGAPFDPSIHEALAVQPVSDVALDGRVVVVHASGYRIGSKLLQAAQVIVGKRMEAAEA